MSKELAFFLRHYNDIDHIVPVIWKWGTTTDVPASVVISNSPDVLDDYRIRFLRGLPNVTVHLREELAPEQHEPSVDPEAATPNSEPGEVSPGHGLGHFLPRFWQRVGPDWLSRILPGRRVDRAKEGQGDGAAGLQPAAHIDSANAASRKESPEERLEREVDAIFDQIMGGVGRGLVVLDWVHDNMRDYLPFARSVAAKARARGFGVVALPHGDEPHKSQMIRIKEIARADADIYSVTGELFDSLVAPNEACASRYRKHLGSRVKVLGSPRYNDEWSTQIRTLLAPYESPAADRKLRMLLFLRHPGYPIFWDEVVRTIEMLVQFPDVELVVVHHTRACYQSDLMKKYPGLALQEHEGYRVVAGDIPSSALVDWADVILDLGTSAVFEAVKLGKPVLELEYLHATYTMISSLIPGTVMLCRDHLYDAVQRFLADGTTQFYNDNERRAFIETMIDVPDGNVLSRYALFLDEALRKGSSIASAAA